MPQNQKVLLLPILPGWPTLEASQLIGFAEDLDEIDAARALAESLGRVDCMFLQGNLDSIPWRDEYFDVAYLGSTATDEVRRVLTRQGVVHECQSKF